jgi:transposase
VGERGGISERVDNPGAKSMMLRYPQRILAYSEPVDMHKSFNGLIALTTQALREDPLSGTFYLFSNRRRNLVKILFWDRTGFCLYAKRLERGRFYFRPGELGPRELELMLDGIAVGGRHGRRNAVQPSA